MRKRMQALLKNEKGFTLVELLAVIVILGIIAAIAIPSVGKIIDNSKKDAHVANAEQLVGAARLAVAANDKTIFSDGYITMDELVTAGYLESAIKDPESATNGPYTVGTVVYDAAIKKLTTVTLTGSVRSIPAGTLVSGLNRGAVNP